jgi:hypothetical protein
MKNVVFWDVTPRDSFVGPDYSEKHIASIVRVTANVPSSPNLVILMMEVVYSSEKFYSCKS